MVFFGSHKKNSLTHNIGENSDSHLFQHFILYHNTKLTFPCGAKSQGGEEHGILEVSNHLVEVLVDLGELGGELLVLEGVALLVEDLGHGGDQQQSLLGVGLGEVD